MLHTSLTAISAVSHLNNDGWLQGFIGMATTGIVIFYILFLSGRQLCKRLLLKRAKVE